MSSDEEGLRVLVYGMQSSGASLFALLLGQLEKSLVVVDLWSPEVAPALSGAGLVAVKATVGKVPLASHLESFRPTTSVLYLRHPVDVATSLASKSYRDYGGALAEKFEKMDRNFELSTEFDLRIHYEDVAAEAASVAADLGRLGIEFPADAYRFRRSPKEIVRFACAASPWCRDGYLSRWGLGGAHVEELPGPMRPMTRRSAEAWRLASRHAPRLLHHYEKTSADSDGGSR